MEVETEPQVKAVDKETAAKPNSSSLMGKAKEIERLEKVKGEEDHLLVVKKNYD